MTRKSRNKVARIRPTKVHRKARGTACPRCGSPDTLATSTTDQIQYRVCRGAVCRHSFKVVR